MAIDPNDYPGQVLFLLIIDSKYIATKNSSFSFASDNCLTTCLRTCSFTFVQKERFLAFKIKVCNPHLNFDSWKRSLHLSFVTKQD